MFFLRKLQIFSQKNQKNTSLQPFAEALSGYLSHAKTQIFEQKLRRSKGYLWLIIKKSTYNHIGCKPIYILV